MKVKAKGTKEAIDFHWEVVLRVGFTGAGCQWVDVPTGEYQVIPAVEARPAQPARREEITVRELQC